MRQQELQRPQGTEGLPGSGWGAGNPTATASPDLVWKALGFATLVPGAPGGELTPAPGSRSLGPDRHDA